MKFSLHLSAISWLILMCCCSLVGQNHLTGSIPKSIQQQYLDRFPDHYFLWNEQTGMPHRAFGKSLSIPGFQEINEETVEPASRQFLSTLPGWHPAISLSLRSAVKRDRIWYVSFIQEVGQIPVLQSEVELRISDQGKVMAFGFDVFSSIVLSENPLLTQEEAVSAFNTQMALLGFDETTLHREPELWINNNITNTEAIPFYSFDWHVTHPTHYENTWIDARTGALLQRHNRLCQATVEGGVSASILPELATDQPDMAALPYLDIHFDNQTITTDSLGQFSIDLDQPTTYSAQLKGPYLNVTRFSASNNDASQSGMANPDDTLSIIWDDANSLISERNVFYHTMRTYRFLKSFDPNLTTLDYPLHSIVEDNSATCNAYWTGTNIHYNTGTSSCINSAHSASTIAHEYGHAINDRVYNAAGKPQGMTTITLHEAMADVTACLLLDEHEFAQGFFGVGTFTRDLLNTRRYPENVVGQQHIDGLILGGSFWDLKDLTSTETAYRLAHFAKYGTPDDPNLGTAFAEYFMEVLIVDDDDGDLANGTPHFNEINQAFCNHGIGLGLFFSNSGQHTELPNTTEYNNPYTVDFQYEPPIENNANEGVVKLHYSFNYFQNETAVEMSATGNNMYQAEIPAQPEGSVVKYYFTYEDEECVFQKIPRGDAVSEHFSFLAGDYTTRWLDDFQTDMGWTAGAPGDNATVGIWERADPQQVNDDFGGLVQPEDDHSVAGTFCYVTGAAHGPLWYSFDVDSGRTTLISPVFDGLDGGHMVVQYFKWFVEGAGSIGNSQDPWRVDISNNGGVDWTAVELTTQVTNLKWTKVQFKIEDFIAPTNNMRLRIIVADDNVGSIVEGLIDDFELLSIADISASKEPDSVPEVHCYPNPASDWVHVQIKSWTSKDRWQASLFSILGKPIWHQAIDEPVTSLDVGQLPAGVYLLELQSNNYQIVLKLQLR